MLNYNQFGYLSACHNLFPEFSSVVYPCSSSLISGAFISSRELRIFSISFLILFFFPGEDPRSMLLSSNINVYCSLAEHIDVVVCAVCLLHSSTNYAHIRGTNTVAQLGLFNAQNIREYSKVHLSFILELTHLYFAHSFFSILVCHFDGVQCGVITRQYVT